MRKLAYFGAVFGLSALLLTFCWQLDVRMARSFEEARESECVRELEKLEERYIQAATIALPSNAALEEQVAQYRGEKDSRSKRALFLKVVQLAAQSMNGVDYTTNVLARQSADSLAGILNRLDRAQGDCPD